MKNRIITILCIVFFCSRLSAQPPETTYTGQIAVNGYADDESYGPFNIGFSFNYYGNTYSQFYINSNGQVLFGAGSFESANTSIPNAAAPNNCISAFWDDLVVDSYGKILYTTIGAAPNRKLVVQFANMGFYPYPANLGTFSIILYESTNVIQVQYRLIMLTYSSKAHGGDATIGVENSTGTAGVQYSYNNPSAVTTDQAISFTPAAGPTYTVNSNAVYDGIFLTTNITLPDPSIPSLISPPLDAIIGTSFTFEWASAANAASYSLHVGTDPELIGSTTYNPGAALSYNVTGLTAGATYYWAVFSQNATGTTWCEIKRFTTSTFPPLATVPMKIWTDQTTDISLKLRYSGGDNDAKTAIITALPAQGQLYQYNSGARGSLISSVPATISDPNLNVIYAATGNAGNGAGNFSYKMHDGTGDSPAGLITVNVNSPILPNLMEVSRGTGVELQFDRAMSDPASKQSQFTVTVNGSAAAATAAALKEGDASTISLTLATPLSGSETVSVSYTAGDVLSAAGGLLSSFSDQSVILKAQKITFPVNLVRKVDETPVTLNATTDSGLSLTYSSSNLPVATIVGSVLTIKADGTSIITARQAGNATWASATYSKTLTVTKYDQTITFNTIAAKFYGDADFALNATASSALPVSYASSNSAVATVTNGLVHITGAGSALITASQTGNAKYYAAPSVAQTIVVGKINLTCTADNKTKVYLTNNPALTYQISGFVLNETSSVIDVLPVASTTAVAGSSTGTYQITISGGSDNNYNFIYMPGILTITKALQTIAFTSVPEKLLVKDTWTLEATATSGLPVSFASLDESLATVSGSSLTGVTKGNVTVKAYNEGDQNYEPAEVTAVVEIYSTHKDIIHLFTPNGDGFNDYWELPDLASWGKCDVKVYSRNGKLVYSNPDYNNLWNGTSNGDPVPEGAYYFIIKTENAGTVKGTVNIVR